MDAVTTDTPSRHKRQLADGDLSYLKWAGKGRASLVFLHANGFNGLTYKKILEAVAGDFAVYSLDLRGHGFSTLSADPANLFGWNRYRDDVISFLDSLDGVGPVVLGGHSLGAATCALVAAKRPDLARGMILFEPVMFPAAVRRVFKVLNGLGLKRIENPMARVAERRRMVFSTQEEVFESYRGRGAFASWPDDMIWDYIMGGTRERSDGSVELTCSGAWEAATYRMVGFPIMRTFAAIKCPVRLIHAEKQSSSPAILVRRLNKRFKHVSSRLIPDSDHFVPMQYWQMAQDEILSVMSTAERG